MGARGADGPATDSRREREGGQRAGKRRPCLARYETGRRRDEARPPSSVASRRPRDVKERPWRRAPRALRCAAQHVRREVGASLPAPITPALKRTKTEASTGGLGASQPLPQAPPPPASAALRRKREGGEESLWIGIERAGRASGSRRRRVECVQHEFPPAKRRSAELAPIRHWARGAFL